MKPQENLTASHSPTVFIEPLSQWQGGKANGYYNPFTNEIHVLRGKDLELRALLHEQYHASRRATLTFRLGSLIQIPVVSNLFFGLLIVTAILTFAFNPGNAYTIQNITPFGFVGGLFSALLLCNGYEEYTASSLAAQSIRAISALPDGDIDTSETETKDISPELTPISPEIARDEQQ